MSPIYLEITLSAAVVSEYDAKTGAVINPGFITGLFFPEGLAVKGNTLFVANAGNTLNNGTVGEYNATTGKAINANFTYRNRRQERNRSEGKKWPVLIRPLTGRF